MRNELKFVLCLCCWVVLVISSNKEIDENMLGIKAVACASKHCNDKDSLELWQAIEWYCSDDYVSDSDSTTSNTFTNFQTGSICASISFLGVLAGWLFGKIFTKRKQSFRYVSIPDEDDDDRVKVNTSKFSSKFNEGTCKRHNRDNEQERF